MTKTKTGEYYSPEIIALAVNFSEVLYEGSYETEDGDRLNRLIIIALEQMGYLGIDAEKLNRSISYYLPCDNEVDITGFEEYHAELPEFDYESVE